MFPRLSSKSVSGLFERASRNPNIPRDCWYLTTSLSLASFNQPHLIPALLGHAYQNEISSTAHTHQPLNSLKISEEASHDEKSRILQRVREGLLKGSVIYGLPRAINALNTLKEDHPKSPTVPHFQPDHSSSSIPRQHSLHDLNAQFSALESGDQLFRTIYGKIANRIRYQLGNTGHPDLLVVADLMYAHILSNDSILGARETSLCVVAALIAMDVEPQLKGHRKGALNTGSTESEVNAIIDVSQSIREMLEKQASSAAKGEALKM